MSQVTVGKGGNNLAVRLPADIAAATQLREGERVEIETQESTILIRRLQPRLSLEEIFQGKSPEEWRTEYAQAYEWGPDIGRGLVEE